MIEKTYLAAIDYSMSCPAICIHENKEITDFNDCFVFFYTDIIKYQKVFNKNIIGMKTHKYKDQQERFDNLSEWALTILKKFNVKKVYIEGYSFGSKGQVFQIGENTGILKNKLYKNKINFETIAPTQVKLSFSGKGNSKKDLMLETFKEKFNIDLLEILNYEKKTIDSPIGDIVDCVAIFNDAYHEKNNINIKKKGKIKNVKN